MEAKIMKMAKKLLAVVLTGVMAVSMLTGCAGISSRRVADELEGMLKAVNDKVPSRQSMTIWQTRQSRLLSRTVRTL